MGKGGKQGSRKKGIRRAMGHPGSGPGPVPGPAPAAGSGPAPGQPGVAEQVNLAVVEAIRHLDAGDGAAFAVAADRVAVGRDTQGRVAPGWREAADRALSTNLTSLVSRLWRAGWEPADLVRAVRRELSEEHAALTLRVIEAELSAYPAPTVDPGWFSQLRSLGAEVRRPSGAGFLVPPGDGDQARWVRTVHAALEVIHAVRLLPRLEPLSPPPGTAGRRPEASRAVDERVLERVRALLAKAESTPYAAEAETFTAGAQALMARHSIDRALLDATAPHREGPGGRRVGIDNPYEGPKVALLDAVARANRCSTVWSTELGFSTVVGFPGDLDAVELLFTSLLVQATTAMTRAGSRQDGLGRSRTRSFRQSFLLAYAGRIGERLAEATAAQAESAAAEPAGEGLLPVLAARHEEVTEAVSALFPHLRTTSIGRARDGEGWASGRASADLARLDTAVPLVGG